MHFSTPTTCLLIALHSISTVLANPPELIHEQDLPDEVAAEMLIVPADPSNLE
jgi:hypothetical protein